MSSPKFVFHNDMKIGELDAERDVILNECFVKTKAYEILSSYEEDSSDFYKRVIVGRTGSGKTALLKIISSSNKKIDVWEDIKAEQVVLQYIQNNEYIFSLIKEGIRFDSFFKALWIGIILEKILYVEKSKEWIRELVRTSKPEHNEYLKNFDTFFEDGIENITEYVGNKINAKVTSLFRDPVTKSSLGLNLGNEEQNSTQKQTITNSIVNKHLLGIQNKIILNLKENLNIRRTVFITVDDLDQGRISDEFRYSFVNALMDAIKSFFEISNIKIIVSIRTDILSGIYNSPNIRRQKEKDLSMILPIEWSKDEIIEIINTRLERLLKNQFSQKRLPEFKSVFNCLIKGKKAFEYILDRIMLRPRDAIDFINNCFREANGETKITSSHILKAESIFYSNRKSALIHEWKSIYPEAKIHLDAVDLLPDTLFSLEDLDYESILGLYDDSAFEKDPVAHSLVEKGGKEGLKALIDFWFSVGVIGLKNTEQNTIYTSFLKPSLDSSEYTKSFKLFPLFARKTT